MGQQCSNNTVASATKEEIVCSGTGSGAYIEDIDYINNKIDTFVKTNVLNFISVYEFSIYECVHIMNIDKSELKTDVSNFAIMDKTYESPELKIVFGFEITDTSLSITAKIKVNPEWFVEKYWYMFIRRDVLSATHNTAINCMLNNHMFSNGICVNINYTVWLKLRETKVFNDTYINRIYLMFGSEDNLYMLRLSIADSSMTLAEMIELINYLQKDESYGIGRGLMSFHNIHYLYKNEYVKHNIVHYDRTYSKTIFGQISTTRFEDLEIIPYCSGCKGHPSRCGNIVLYGNKIIEFLIRKLNKKDFVVKDGCNMIELIIPEINITAASISYLQEVLSKYNMSYTIHKITMFRGKTSYKVSLICPTMTLVPTISCSIDLTDDLSSSDSVNSLSGLLGGFSTRSVPAITAATYTIRSRPVGAG